MGTVCYLGAKRFTSTEILRKISANAKWLSGMLYPAYVLWCQQLENGIIEECVIPLTVPIRHPATFTCSGSLKNVYMNKYFPAMIQRAVIHWIQHPRVTLYLEEIE